MQTPDKPNIPKNFRDFWPFYLSQHQNPTNRFLHFIGTTMAIVVLALSILSHNKRLLFLIPVVSYGPAWIGHFFFEKNRPATFKAPLFSLLGDLKMYVQELKNKIKS